MHQVRPGIALWAAVVMVAAGVVRAGETLEVGRGETPLVVVSGASTSLSITPLPGGLLSVYNFTSGPCRLVPEDGDALLEVPAGTGAYGAELAPDMREPYEVRLEASGDGDVWIYVVADGDELAASHSSAMYTSRARFLQAGADAFDAAGRSDEACRWLLRAGSDLHAGARPGEALQLFERVAERASGTPWEVEALVAEASVRLDLGRHAEALDAARTALERLEGAEGPEAALHRHGARLLAAEAEGDAHAAYGHARAALEALPAVVDRLDDGGLATLVLCAEALRRAGRPDVADTLAEQAWSLARAGDAQVARRVYGEAFDRRRERYADRDAAAVALERLEALAQTTPQRIDDLRRRSLVTRDRGEASELLAEALRLGRDVLPEEELAVLAVSHASALAREGFVEVARDVAQEVCEQLEPSWHPELRYAALRTAAQLRVELLATRVEDTASLSWTREWNAAGEALDSARAIGVERGVPEWVDEVDYYLAYVESLVPERHAEALARAGRALASGRDREDRDLVAAASTLVAHLTADPSARLDRARSAIRAAREGRNPDVELRARAIAARALLAEGDLARFEEQRRVAQSLAREALDDVTMSDDVASRRAARSGVADWASVEQDWVAARLERDPRDRVALGAGLGGADFWARLGLGADAAPGALGDVSSRVGSDTVVLRYADGGDDLYVYVVTDEGVEHRVVGDRLALIIRAGEFVRRIADRDALGDVQTVVELGHPLWRQLVADVASDALEGRGQLVVVPTPSLGRFPFEALVVEPGDAPPRFADVAFALGRHRVRYAPSLADALDARPSRPLASMLVAADPIAAGETAVVRGRALQALPGSREEALAIADLVGVGVDLRLGGDAHRAAVVGALGAAHDVLHFAVHGLVGDDPRAAGLVLADGLLSTEDIRGREIGAALVVLSACDTASGRLRVSQRVDSLANAFHAAGAGGVVATLWPVRDVSTAALMRTFYDALVARRVSAPDALDEARRAVLAASIDELVGDLARADAERGRPLRTRTHYDVPDGHPYLWAPFVYLGRPVTLER